MLKTLVGAFKNKDIRKKILYTLMILVIVRVGSLLPIPGVDTEYFSSLLSGINTGDLSYLSAFTGGSFERMSLFALSITPYITSSIIMQFLAIAIPKLEEMQKEGEDGRKKIAAITRYVTIALALIESIAMAVGFGRSGLIKGYQGFSTLHYIVSIIVVVAALTAGSAMLMWLGERITENGVGNGISIVLLINIISGMPSDFATLYSTFVAPRTIAKGVLAAAIIIAILVVMVVLVCFLQDGERRIPVQYSQKVSGRKTFGGQSTNIPLKVNTAGVMPVIFASSLMQFPVIIAQLFGKSYEWTRYLSSSYWCRISAPKYSIGLILYIVLLIIFAYFYTSITFNPIEVADNLKKAGGVIPGITPGKSTSDYLNNILNYIVFVGAVGLLIIALIPIMCTGFFNASVSFGGTSVIIIVGVVLETLKQIESQMVNRYYKGFLSE
ncbi:MAG: preprotein translocase subunit SecY [Eubacterium sp.]|nr:preprotein translocase subunit SecY [Lachnospira sp.]MBS5269022.1 preprotein translocase subunit SecY [Eubacterium sp.]